MSFVSPQKCISCRWTYYLDGDICKKAENECYCNNGVAATGSDCYGYKIEVCVSCNSGYKLRGRSCYEFSNVLEGNPHGGNNCEYYGLEPEQRGDYFVTNDHLDLRWKTGDKAWNIYTRLFWDWQWFGWKSSSFKNRKFRITFKVNVFEFDTFTTPMESSNNTTFYGLRVFGKFYDSWLKDGIQQLEKYYNDITIQQSENWVDADESGLIPNEGDDYRILMIFFDAHVDFGIKDFIFSVCDP